MDYKRSKAPTNTVTHNLMDFCEGTDNIYESIAIMSKRSNQISVKMKEDLSKNSRSLLRATTIWKRPSKTANRLKYPATTRNCPRLRSSRPTSS